jgi:hypothetical protein
MFRMQIIDTVLYMKNRQAARKDLTESSDGPWVDEANVPGASYGSQLSPPFFSMVFYNDVRLTCHCNPKDCDNCCTQALRSD